MSNRFEVRVPMKLSGVPGLCIICSSHRKRETAERALKREQKTRPDAFIHDLSANPQWRAS